MSRDALVWTTGTVLAAWLAAPIDWRVAVVCILGALGARSPLWLATCAAGIWVPAVLSGQPFALPLLLWATVQVGRHVRGPHRHGLVLVLLVAGLFQGLRAWGLAALVPASDASSPLMLGGLVLAGLAAGTPAGRLPAGALAGAGLGLAVAAGVSGLGPLNDAAAISAAARWKTLPHAPAEIPSLRLRLWAVREAPTWHTNARTLPLERALSMGWWPTGAQLTTEEQIRVARWLDTQGRGGEAIRLLRQSPDHQSQWWLAYFLARAGHVRQTEHVAVRPPAEAVHLAVNPLGAVGLFYDQTLTIPIHLDESIHGVAVVASAEWFEGPPHLMLQLDGVDYVIAPERSPRRYTIPVALGPGPHYLQLTYADDRSGPMGDRNIYVHAIFPAALSPSEAARWEPPSRPAPR